MWEGLVKQYIRVLDRCDYLRDYPDDPDAVELQTKTTRSVCRLLGMEQDFIEWAEPDLREFVDVLAACCRSRMSADE